MRRLSILLVVFVLFAATTTSAGCGLSKSNKSGTKESSPTVAESSQPSTSATTPPAATSPPATVVPDAAPAERLACGNWKALRDPMPFYLQDGDIYYENPKVPKYRCGAYEVVDPTNIRLVLFQGCYNDGWDPDDPSTYPWHTSEVFYLGSNMVRIMSPSLMDPISLDFVKISDPEL